MEVELPFWAIVAGMRAMSRRQQMGVARLQAPVEPNGEGEGWGWASPERVVLNKR